MSRQVSRAVATSNRRQAERKRKAEEAEAREKKHREYRASLSDREALEMLQDGINQVLRELDDMRDKINSVR